MFADDTVICSKQVEGSLEPGEWKLVEAKQEMDR